MTDTPSRITDARRRVTETKELVVALAAVGFVAIALLARVTHPGQASASTGSGTGSGGSSQSANGGFAFGSGSFGPSTGAPDVQSTVS